MGRPTVVGLVRLYVYQNGVTNVFDFPKAEASRQMRRLAREGWITYHTEFV